MKVLAGSSNQFIVPSGWKKNWRKNMANLFFAEINEKPNMLYLKAMASYIKWKMVDRQECKCSW